MTPIQQVFHRELTVQCELKQNHSFCVYFLIYWVAFIKEHSGELNLGILFTYAVDFPFFLDEKKSM